MRSPNVMITLQKRSLEVGFLTIWSESSDHPKWVAYTRKFGNQLITVLKKEKRFWYRHRIFHSFLFFLSTSSNVSLSLILLHFLSLLFFLSLCLSDAITFSFTAILFPKEKKKKRNLKEKEKTTVGIFYRFSRHSRFRSSPMVLLFMVPFFPPVPLLLLFFSLWASFDEAHPLILRLSKWPYQWPFHVGME